MKTINLGAWEYLQRFDPAVWTKAYFSHGPKVDNISNNMCEVWNTKIVEYQEKPILIMCEDLRCYLMRKIATHKKKLENHSGHLAPVQQKKLDEFVKPKANKSRAIWAGDNDRVLFELHRGTNKVGVNLQQRTCTCNVWQLTAMYKISLKPEDHVHKWLTMQSIKATYMHCIKPVNSEEYWNPCDAPKTEPPNIKRSAYSPKIKRKDGGSNVNLNNDNVQPAPPMDQLTKAKKNKKKIPKTLPRKDNFDPQEQRDKISLSQNAPQAKEVARESINLNQSPPQSNSTPNLNHVQRRKHPIVRPRLATAPISVPPSFELSTPPYVQEALGLRPYVPTEHNVNPRTTITNVPL
ncbi:uncharacterized protein LOC107647607 [Arachis ipaensis]|uniref:uncharacterized protein LOC107647607 n=1 Tax=Arachis ipaensis TaxID=130454 RepID=UPI0007AFCAE9|nr:uncharacterized protein LOC107647607 [Arachis ipaensis]XP_025662019.1 uncharacterized protein LOC112757679 [Arachis hypogaea]